MSDDGDEDWWAENAKYFNWALPQRFKDAIPLAVELSGFDADFWERTMSFCEADVRRIEDGYDIVPEDLRSQKVGTITGLYLAHLGHTPPEDLAREFDRRLETMQSVDHPKAGIGLREQANWYSSDADEALDQVERTRKTWETMRAIVAAFDPGRPKT